MKNTDDPPKPDELVDVEWVELFAGFKPILVRVKRTEGVQGALKELTRLRRAPGTRRGS